MIRVLIIEDDQDACNVIRKSLWHDMIASECACSFDAGLEKIAEMDFDGVILDLGLPGNQSSMEIVHRIPELGRRAVIVTTGSEDREIIREVAAYGAAHMLKPIDLLDLKQRLTTRIEQFRPSPEVEEKHIQYQRQGHRSPTPWWTNWLSLAGFTIALLGATGTAGAWLYRTVSDEAKQAEKNQSKFDAHEKMILQMQNSMERIITKQGDLEMKAQISLEDRANIHHEMVTITQSAADHKNDVIRRLERIEDKLDKRGN